MLLAGGILAASAQAHDLGTRGTTYPIDEPDLLETLLAKLAAVDWQAKSEEVLQGAEYQVHHYAWAHLTPASETRTRYIDPTITLRSAISVPTNPKKPDGPWKVVYPAGTKVNPLEKVRPPTRMLVFDPRVPEQVAFATAALHAWPLLIELVSTGGDLKALAEHAGRPVYYAGAPFIERFGLVHTPALIGVGQGARKDFLAVTEFGPAQATAPTAVEAVQAAWYGLEAPVSAPTHGKIGPGRYR